MFYYFNRIKLWKAAPSGRQAGINERTAQAWAKRLKEDPEWNIYEKDTNKVNREGSQLQDAHKEYLYNFFDEYPQANRQDAVYSLTEAFDGLNLKKTVVGDFILHDCNLSIKKATLHPVARNSSAHIQARFDWVTEWSKTDMDYLQNCVFVDEAGFNINMRSPHARPVRGTPAIVETPTTRAISHTILGAISAIGVICVEIREPLKPERVKIVGGGNKRKKTTSSKIA